MMEWSDEAVEVYNVSFDGTIMTNCTIDPKSASLPVSGFEPDADLALKCLYIFVISTSLLLNAVIAAAFAAKRIKFSAINILILNLVLADFFTAAGLIPYIAVSPKMLGKYDMKTANFLCAITFGKTFFWVANTASVFTLCMISINRYIMINHGTKPWILSVKKKKTTIWSVVFIWIIGFLLVLPNFFARRFEKCSGICWRNWPEHFSGTAYAICTTVLGYVIPISVLFYTFIAIVRTLWLRRRLPGSDLAVLRARRLVVTLLGSLIFAFIVCWSPFAVYWILSRTTRIFPPGIDGHYVRSRGNHVTILVALMNTVLDPVVYGFKSSDIRKALFGRWFAFQGSRDTSIRSLDQIDFNNTIKPSVLNTVRRTAKF